MRFVNLALIYSAGPSNGTPITATHRPIAGIQGIPVSHTSDACSGRWAI